MCVCVFAVSTASNLAPWRSVYGTDEYVLASADSKLFLYEMNDSSRQASLAAFSSALSSSQELIHSINIVQCTNSSQDSRSLDIAVLHLGTRIMLLQLPSLAILNAQLLAIPTHDIVHFVCAHKARLAVYTNSKIMLFEMSDTGNDNLPAPSFALMYEISFSEEVVMATFAHDRLCFATKKSYYILRVGALHKPIPLPIPLEGATPAALILNHDEFLLSTNTQLGLFVNAEVKPCIHSCPPPTLLS